MLRRFAAALVLTAIASAQTAPAPPAKKPKTAPAATAAKPGTSAKAGAAAIGPETPVMYVSGLCALGASTAAAKPVPNSPPGQCVRAVTKAQFERMVAGMGARAAAADKAQLAEYYMRALLIDNESRKLKLDQDPAVAQAIWMGRVAALGDALHKHFQKQFGNVADADIQKFYDENKQQFDEATVRRVVIPKPPQKGEVEKPAAPEKSEAAPNSPSAAKTAQPAAPELPYEQQVAMSKAYAEKLLARARAGEDLEKLQKESFATAKLEVEADTNAVPLHRGQLPPAHDEKIFATKAGEVTPLIEEPNAFLFYKVEKRREVPLAEARAEIKEQMIAEKEEAAVRRVFTSGRPQLNPLYFTPPQPPAPNAQPQPEPQTAAPPQAEAPKEPAASEPPKQQAEPPAEPEKPKSDAPAEPPRVRPE